MLSWPKRLVKYWDGLLASRQSPIAVPGPAYINFAHRMKRVTATPRYHWTFHFIFADLYRPRQTASPCCNVRAGVRDCINDGGLEIPWCGPTLCVSDHRAGHRCHRLHHGDDNDDDDFVSGWRHCRWVETGSESCKHEDSAVA